MRITKAQWIGIIFAVIIIAVDFAFFFGESLFIFLLGISIAVLLLPFLVQLIVESNIEKEKNERFLDFTRSLAESVKAGTPVGKSIVNMSNKNFGSLTPHIIKLANQISLGIPIGRALETFAVDVDSLVVKRAVTLIREAENAGGQIDYILDSTAESIYQIEKLKGERRAAISSLVVQGYIIFFIFIGIMLVMQFKILPLTAGISAVGDAGSLEDATGVEAPISGTSEGVQALARPFLYLLLIQGIFTGLTIGKISEGSVRAGIKHSIILTLTALLVTSGANAFL